MINALYELWQAILMMAFIGGMIFGLVWIDMKNQLRKRRNRYVDRSDKVLDREPHSKNFSRIHRDWRKL
jgi:hypothetical protein